MLKIEASVVKWKTSDRYSLESNLSEKAGISTKILLKKLQEVKPEKSPGNDNIYSVVLKNMNGTLT